MAVLCLCQYLLGWETVGGVGRMLVLLAMFIVRVLPILEDLSGRR